MHKKSGLNTYIFTVFQREKVTRRANKETIKSTFENSPWRNLCKIQRRQRRKALFTFCTLFMASKSAVAILTKKVKYCNWIALNFNVRIRLDC